MDASDKAWDVIEEKGRSGELKDVWIDDPHGGPGRVEIRFAARGWRAASELELLVQRGLIQPREAHLVAVEAYVRSRDRGKARAWSDDIGAVMAHPHPAAFRASYEDPGASGWIARNPADAAAMVRDAAAKLG